MAEQEMGHMTGTMDKEYNIIWFTQACLSTVLRLENYAKDAEKAGDTELADYFRRAQSDSRKEAEMAKQMLRARLNA
jgi:hypothetical protein